MPRKKKFLRYPEEYAQLIRQSLHSDTVVQCNALGRARSLRNDLYNYREVYWEQRKLPHPYLRCEELERALQGMTISVQLNGTKAEVVISQPSLNRQTTETPNVRSNTSGLSSRD